MDAEDPSKLRVSFEFYPPRGEGGEETFMNKTIPSFVQQNPIFLDLTWGAGGSTSGTTMRLCKELQEKYPDIPINMHVTCTNMPQGLIKDALDFAKENSIHNILALRGDPPAGEEFKANPDGFHSALDLVQYIRQNYGDYFCISVAGYPEGHSSRIGESGCISDEDYQKEINYLKQKVDAGANFIVTQLFYDPSLFVKFVKKCRENGITVPILPGLLPITTYNGLQRMINLCKTHIPHTVAQKVEELKDNPTALKEYGVEQCVEMIQFILASGIGCNHLHFYTLNSTHQTFEVMQRLNLLM